MRFHDGYASAHEMPTVMGFKSSYLPGDGVEVEREKSLQWEVAGFDLPVSPHLITKKWKYERVFDIWDRVAIVEFKVELSTLFELLIPALILSLVLHEFRRILLNLTTAAIISGSFPTFSNICQSELQSGFLSVYINIQIHAMFVPTSCLCIIVVGAITVP